jgi:hypothetical protein
LTELRPELDAEFSKSAAALRNQDISLPLFSPIRNLTPLSRGFSLISGILPGTRKTAFPAVFLFAKPKCGLRLAYVFNRLHG